MKIIFIFLKKLFEFIFILIFDQKIDSTITINSKLVKIFTICFKVFYGKIINFIYGELKKAIYTLIFIKIIKNLN